MKKIIILVLLLPLLVQSCSKEKEVNKLAERVTVLEKQVAKLVADKKYGEAVSSEFQKSKSENRYAKEIALKEKYTVNQLCAMYYKAQTDKYKNIIKRALARKLNPSLSNTGGIGMPAIAKANNEIERYKSKRWRLEVGR